ncbi:hypothetical protein Plec18167_008100 [Paecilomyces lecythidis]|uniref:Uncharacterized protein n=1 Tax=Paecilomyces lecythidis TaxID=3004212 RepID=A0ABR3WYM5_9EURO
MPRQKRALSKVDPNSRSNTPKETSSGKRRATSATKSTMETSSSNNTASTPVPQDSSSGKGKATCTTRSITETSSSNAASNAQSNERDDINAAAPKFIGLPRPFWDIDEEVPYDEDNEDDEDGEDGENGEDDVEDTEAPKAPRGQDKNAAERESPDWLWVMSELAVDKYRQLVEQARKRDQDEHDLHIYNDFSAYGINEVVDNWLKDFNKEVVRRVISPYAVWAQLEAFAWFSQLDYVQIWFHGDDGHGFAETVALVGKALLTGLNILKTRQLLKPYNPEVGGGIRNISLILALFVRFAKSWDDIGGSQYGEIKWVSKVGKLAKENGIDIKGPYNFDQVAEKMLQEEEEEDPNKPRQKKKVVRFSEGTWGIAYTAEIYSDEDELAIRDSGDYSKIGWKEAFKDYSKKHGHGAKNTIGGSAYDITRMSKLEKKQYQLGF